MRGDGGNVHFAVAAAQAAAVAAKAAAAAVDNAPCWDAPESLERLWQVQAAAKFREELCALDLDAPPAEDLSAFHELWGAENEAEAASQLLSFAACRSLSAFQRSRALQINVRVETPTLRSISPTVYSVEKEVW